MTHSQSRRAADPPSVRQDCIPWPAAAAGALFLFALYQGLATQHARDFFIYRLGAELALRGENPYDLEKLQQHVAAAYPADDANTREFVANCGYFLPPQAIVLFLPFALMPAVAAKVVWAALNGVTAYAVARLPGLFRPADAPPPSFLARLLLPFALVLNPLTLGIVFVGQVTLVSVGCIAAGLWLICGMRNAECGSSLRAPHFVFRTLVLLPLLWSVPFLKPHLALPLIPLLWFLVGWRPALVLFGLIAVLNLIGAAIVGGTPLYLGEYLETVSQAHKAVGFNRVELNPRITSWNCLLVRAGGPLVELSALGTLAGYLIWFGLVAGRIALAGARPAASWAVAAAAVGAVLCSQVLVYELLILALVTPWLRDLFVSGHRLRAWLGVVLLTLQLVPPGAFEALGVSFPPSLGVALLAILVLAGPIATVKTDAEETGDRSH